MRPIIFSLATAALFATAPFALAQSTAPSPTPAGAPMPSPTPRSHHKKAMATPAASPAATMATPQTGPAAKTPAPAMTPATAGASPAPMKQTRAQRKAAGAAANQEVLNATPAPGGGNGMVWVNTKSHVYHKEGSRFYGKTKAGKYLSEKDAMAEGDKASGHGE